MISITKRFEVINRLRKGEAIRAISREMDIDRKTIRRIRDEYQEASQILSEASGPKQIEEATEKLVLEKKYDSSNRKRTVFTEDIEKRMKKIQDSEDLKDEILGPHKQSLNATDVYEILKDEGYEISYRTVCRYWTEMNQKPKEAFIKQLYELGERAEFDFGEVKLEIAKFAKTYYLAVWACPASGFHWAYLYENQKKAAFKDAHVRFFELIGGVHKEIVYDNMRNVVSRFIGKNEKELNEDLIQLSLYYGFSIDVTNCFRGNEKGTVESRVKTTRQKIFSKKYQFETLEEAREYMAEVLKELNKDSRLEEEKEHLLDYRPPFETADIRNLRVTKYSTVHFETNQYSVPDHLVGHQVKAKIYADKIVVYANDKEVARHKKIEGSHGFCLDIYHYIKTFKRKPGALRRSQVLKQNPELETLYYKYYNPNPREFIDFLEKNQKLSIDKLYQQAELEKTLKKAQCTLEDSKDSEDSLLSYTAKNLHYLNLIYGLEDKNANNS